MTTTVREFIQDCYSLVTASSPTVPLQGSDLKKGIRALNRLLEAYSSTGLRVTIASTQTISITAGTSEIVCGDADYVPTPDITAGRLANAQEAWLELSGVTYPLEIISQAEFNESWKYEPLQGLPGFIVPDMQPEIVTLRLYPAASQAYEFNLRGKFQPTTLTSNDTLISFPKYYERFLWLAVARDLAFSTARSEAWTQKLENMYLEAEKNIINASEINVGITGRSYQMLNGAWRVKAGI